MAQKIADKNVLSAYTFSRTSLLFTMKHCKKWKTLVIPMHVLMKHSLYVSLLVTLVSFAKMAAWGCLGQTHENQEMMYKMVYVWSPPANMTKWSMVSSNLGCSYHYLVTTTITLSSQLLACIISRE